MLVYVVFTLGSYADFTFTQCKRMIQRSQLIKLKTKLICATCII